MYPAPGTPIVVGMSGGVDSSVAALLLHRQGYRVIGLFMKNWDEKNGPCPAAADYESVARVCDRIGIPYYSVNFEREYWDGVFSKFIDEYRRGLTPNPDVLCNREIKFNAFADHASRALGAEWIATGHYCRTSSGGSGGIGPGDGAQTPRLLKGLDPGKDQSYFLHAVPGAKLARALFPIGHLPKPEVRRLALEAGLPTHDRKDSTGICFIGERDFPEFMSRYVQAQPGWFETLDGRRVGRHRGAAYYTLGQRRGLGLGGEGGRWFVLAKDMERNVVTVERGTDHPALFAPWLEASDEAWVAGAAPPLPLRLSAKIRYRQADQACVLERAENGALRARFDEPQRAITPGQAVVFYDGDACLGGAVIRAAGPSLFEAPGADRPPLSPRQRELAPTA